MLHSTFLISLLGCVAVSGQTHITEFNVPPAVALGEDVELKCKYEVKGEDPTAVIVKWWQMPFSDNDTRTLLYQRVEPIPGGPVRHNVVLKAGEQDTIVLPHVSPADSGRYECEVSNLKGDKKEDRHHQDLIVFTPGTGPQLNVTTVADGPDKDLEDDVSIYCEAGGVAPYPDLIVKVAGQEVYNMTKLVSGPNNKGLYEIYGSATVSKEDALVAAIECELVYLNPSVSHIPYLAIQAYSSGMDSTTEPLELTTEPDITTQSSLQDQSGHGSHSHATWKILLMIVPMRLALMV